VDECNPLFDGRFHEVGVLTQKTHAVITSFNIGLDSRGRGT